MNSHSSGAGGGGALNIPIIPEYFVNEGSTNITGVKPGVVSYIVYDVKSKDLEQPSLGCFKQGGRPQATKTIHQTFAHISQIKDLGTTGRKEGERSTERSTMLRKDKPKIRVYCERLRNKDGYWYGTRFFICVYDTMFRFGEGLDNLIICDNPEVWEKKRKDFKKSSVFSRTEEYRFILSASDWARILDGYWGKANLTISEKLNKVKDIDRTFNSDQNPGCPEIFFSLERSLINARSNKQLREKQYTPAAYYPAAGTNTKILNGTFKDTIIFPYPDDVFEIDHDNFTPEFMDRVLLPGAVDDLSHKIGKFLGTDSSIELPYEKKCIYNIPDEKIADPRGITEDSANFSDRLMNFQNAKYNIKPPNNKDVISIMREKDPLFGMSEKNRNTKREIGVLFKPGSEEYKKAMRLFKTAAVEEFKDYMFSNLPARTNTMKSVADYLKKIVTTRKTLCQEPIRVAENLTVFGNMIARKFYQLNDVCKLWTTHRQLFTLFYSSMNAYAFYYGLHMNILNTGANQTSKTYNLECLQNILMIPGTINLVNHVTTNSYNTDTNRNDEVTAFSEAPLSSLGMDNKGKQMIADPQEKDRLTQCRTESYRCVISQEGISHLQISVCSCVGVTFKCTNEMTTSMSDAITSRYYHMISPSASRKDISNNDASSSAHVDEEKMYEISEEWKMEQACIYILENFIRLNIIDLDMEVGEMELNKISKEIKEKSGIGMSDRDRTRILCIARSLTLAYAIEVLFRSELSSRFKTEVFLPEHLLHAEPLLRCTKEIIWFSITLLEDMFIPVRHFEVVRSALELYNVKQIDEDKPYNGSNYLQTIDPCTKQPFRDYRYYYFSMTKKQLSRALSESMNDPRPSCNEIISILTELTKMNIVSRKRDEETGFLKNGRKGETLTEKIPAVKVDHQEPFHISIAVDLFYKNYSNLIENAIKQTRDQYDMKFSAISAKEYVHQVKETSQKNPKNTVIKDEIPFPHLLQVITTGPNVGVQSLKENVYAIDRTRHVFTYAPSSEKTSFEKKKESRTRFELQDEDMQYVRALQGLLQSGYDPKSEFALLSYPKYLEDRIKLIRSEYKTHYDNSEIFDRYPNDVAHTLYMEREKKLKVIRKIKLKKKLHSQLPCISSRLKETIALLGIPNKKNLQWSKHKTPSMPSTSSSSSTSYNSSLNIKEHDPTLLLSRFSKNNSSKSNRSRRSSIHNHDNNNNNNLSIISTTNRDEPSNANSFSFTGGADDVSNKNKNKTTLPTFIHEISSGVFDFSSASLSSSSVMNNHQLDENSKDCFDDNQRQIAQTMNNLRFVPSVFPNDNDKQKKKRSYSTSPTNYSSSSFSSSGVSSPISNDQSLKKKPRLLQKNTSKGKFTFATEKYPSKKQNTNSYSSNTTSGFESVEL